MYILISRSSQTESPRGSKFTSWATTNTTSSPYGRPTIFSLGDQYNHKYQPSASKIEMSIHATHSLCSQSKRSKAIAQTSISRVWYPQLTYLQDSYFHKSLQYQLVFETNGKSSVIYGTLTATIRRKCISHSSYPTPPMNYITKSSPLGLSMQKHT